MKIRIRITPDTLATITDTTLRAEVVAEIARTAQQQIWRTEQRIARLTEQLTQEVTLRDVAARELFNPEPVEIPVEGWARRRTRREIAQ